MPSPFPGMDPYLEDCASWGDVHHRLISVIGEQLQPRLNPRGYYVSIEERTWSKEATRAIVPEIAVIQRTNRPRPGGVGVDGLVADEPVRIARAKNEVHEAFLQIYRLSPRNLITEIEVISPSNKTNAEARRLYIQKRRELRANGVSLVEVDLLRAGKPLVRLPRRAMEMNQPDGRWVNIIRAWGADYEFFPVGPRERLPRVGVPLAEDEGDVVFDLQAALERAYDMGAYSMRIDYNREPVPPWDEASRPWAHDLLVAAGLRRPSEKDPEAPGAQSQSQTQTPDA